MYSPNELQAAEGQLPHRLKPLMATVVQTADWPWWALAVQAGCAGVLSAFTGLPDSQRFMAWAIGFDLITGFLCGIYTRGGVSARAMTRGATVKAVTFALVHYLGEQPHLAVGIGSLQMSLGAATALWYGVADWFSVLENLDELGAPVPPFLRSLLAKGREAMNRVEIADKAAAMLFGPSPSDENKPEDKPNA